MLLIEFIIVTFYCLSLFLLFIFSLGQLHLVYHYLKRGNHQENQDNGVKKASLPLVTIQLPIYNELYVVERLIKAVVNIEYPKEKLEIQVLDDSTDQTKDKIVLLVAKYRKEGINIRHIIRDKRTGYKAGALQYGLHQAKGEFLAIFDADFIPGKDFLIQSVPIFQDQNIGMVQTRWGHVNQDFSLLTKLQAFGLDAHFSIEQNGRSHAGSFINFNGTAGIWRKQCILDAGGWSADTLTEDLDLSYRAQIKGWKFKYLEEVVAPAELPILMSAVKSQQFRWNKGAAETARKNIKKVLKSDIRLINKIHAVFHLFNSSVFVFLLIAALLSIPMLFIKNTQPDIEILFNLGTIFLIGFLSIGIFYWISSKKFHRQAVGKYYITMFPTFLTILMGLSLHNSIAVLKGWLGFKSPFIRTPKFNITKSRARWKENKYVKHQLDFQIIMEGILSLYFFFGIFAGFYLADFGLLFFHIMLALGFASVFYYSVQPLRNA